MSPWVCKNRILNVVHADFGMKQKATSFFLWSSILVAGIDVPDSLFKPCSLQYFSSWYLWNCWQSIYPNATSNLIIMLAVCDFCHTSDFLSKFHFQKSLSLLLIDLCLCSLSWRSEASPIKWCVHYEELVLPESFVMIALAFHNSNNTLEAVSIR